MLPQSCASSSKPQTARASDDAVALPFGHSLLQGQYRIERELMAGGFGITYLARDSLDRQVVIKECYPAGFCIRDGAQVTTGSPFGAKSFKNVLRHFLREAQWLARVQHDNIVAVHQVFKENGTAYIAMECIDGCDLVTLRGEDPARLDQRLLADLLEQALQALSVLHAKGVLHRDIAPDNFLIDGADHLTLIDFGAASGVAGDEDTALGAMLSVKDGYSPHEFYQPDMPQRLSSDLYALGATFYFLVTGAPPAEAQARLKAVTAGYADPCPLLEEGDWPFAPGFLRTIDKAMSILPGMRFQSAAEWAESLPEDLSVPAPETAQPEPAAVPEAAISDLVAATNHQLAPCAAQRGRARIPPAAPAAQPVQMVDLFGEPISDVDHWLETQDQLARARRQDAGPLGTKAEARPGPESEPPQVVRDRAQTSKRNTGWAGRLARMLGSDTRQNTVTVNGKTT